MFTFLSLLLQLGPAQKLAVPALRKVNEATDAILAQENTTIKMLWGMLCLMLGTILLIVAVGILAWRMWGYVKGREKEVETKKQDAELDISEIKTLRERVEGLVSLYAKSQAVDQGQHENHTVFVQKMLETTQATVRELYAETQRLQQNAREQDKESMNMVAAMQQVLELFSSRLATLQESLVNSISMREANHIELCTLLNLILAILTGQPPKGGTAAITAALSSMYKLSQTPDGQVHPSQ